MKVPKFLKGIRSDPRDILWTDRTFFEKFVYISDRCKIFIASLCEKNLQFIYFKVFVTLEKIAFINRFSE